MRILQRKTKKVITVSLLLILSMSSILMLFPLNPTISENVNELDGEEKSTEMKSPVLSYTGSHGWWNRSFEFRRLINITNPHTEAFTDFISNVTFKSTDPEYAILMTNNLKDVRIVEKGVIRNYYIETNFPRTNYVTIYFETNISAGPITEYDTYMYYGNDEVDFAYNYLMDKNPDGLIWYKFEEIVNGEVIDSMGNYNATVNGAFLNSDSAVGSNALSFDGSNDYLAMQNKYYNTQNGITELTVCAFFKTGYSSGTWSNNWAIFDFDRSEHFNFYVRGDGGLGFSSFAYGWDETFNWDPNENPYQDNNYDDFHTTTSGLNDGVNWHFGCALYDGSDKVLYIDDGVEDARNDDAHSGLGIGDGTGRYGIIGDGSEATSEGTPRNNIYYNGLLDEIRYFEEALSPERVEWIAKNYDLKEKLNEEQEKRASITIIAKDIDGRIVPGVEVYMFNNSFASHENYLGTTGELGNIDFLDVNRSRYIITANYSINNGTHTFERVVFDSSDYNIVYDFSGGDFFTIYINLSLWSIDFEIEDWDYDPMGYGYVLVYNKSSYTDLIANLTLDKEFGTTTFRWSNTSNDAKYYYEVYYDNEDYTQPRPLINKSYVDRATYQTNKLNELNTIEVKKVNQHDTGFQKYLVEERIYATGSNETHIGNIKIINTTVILSGMVETLDEISIYYIDYNNTVHLDDPIFSKEYISQTGATIKLNVTEDAEAYGLFIFVEGTNSSGICDGTIDVNYTETCIQYVRVNMSKLVINVFDSAGEWNPTYGNVYVELTNGTSGADITTLLTTYEGSAKGQINSDLDFWYINHNGTSSQIYNFTLFYSGAYRAFNVSSDPSNYDPPGFRMWYNYTLYGNGTIEFRIQTSITDFRTEFQDEIYDINGEWGLNFDFSIKFMSTDNAGSSWDPVIDPDFVDWEITDLLGDIVFDSGEMNHVGSGRFNETIDSGNLIGGEQYYFVISGGITGYQEPAPVQLLFTVIAKTASIGVYNTSDLTSLGSNVTQYYGETIDLTVLYRSAGVLLEGATVSYDWQFIDNPIVISENPAGYYSFIINTSIADVGTYKIDISAELQNYSSFIDYRFDIVIVHRPTSLNDDTSLHLISKILWVGQPYNFTFEYKDILSDPHVNLIDLDQAYYQWYEVSTNGSIIGAISEKINLVEGLNSTYILDFNTNSREVGYYAIFITMQKNNYEVRTALIDLTIQKRIITWDLTATNLVQNQIKIIQGEDVYLELSLTDLSDPIDPQNITGATVMLILGSQEYELTDDDGDGIYIYTFTTDNIDTFFAARVFTGEISIIREDYISEEIPITIVVGMTEIFPGFPMFYFLMIVGSAVAIVGSLATYRIVQQRRIPTFVKKARAMKKSIKGKKGISDSLLYPSKEEYIVKKLGDKWESIGLSLGDIIGVKEKMKKKLPEVEQEFKGGTA